MVTPLNPTDQVLERMFAELQEKGGAYPRIVRSLRELKAQGKLTDSHEIQAALSIAEGSQNEAS